MHIFEATVKGLDKTVDLAFEGRPGPVHKLIPEDLTCAGPLAKDQYDICLNVNPMTPDQARPMLIKAHITRPPLPHFSRSPHGALVGLGETIGERLHLS